MPLSKAKFHDLKHFTYCRGQLFSQLQKSDTKHEASCSEHIQFCTVVSTLLYLTMESGLRGVDPYMKENKASRCVASEIPVPSHWCGL